MPAAKLEGHLSPTISLRLNKEIYEKLHTLPKTERVNLMRTVLERGVREYLKEQSQLESKYAILNVELYSLP